MRSLLLGGQRLRMARHVVACEGEWSVVRFIARSLLGTWPLGRVARRELGAEDFAGVRHHAHARLDVRESYEQRTAASQGVMKLCIMFTIFLLHIITKEVVKDPSSVS